MANQYPIGKHEFLLGWVCNQKCIFCSVGHKLKLCDSIKTFKEVKKGIRKAKEMSIRVISFSGGEPTLIPYLSKAVAYANKLGFEEIEIQTNGRMFAYEEYANKTIDAGANRFLFSIHADNAKLHDSLVMTKGAFDQAVKGIKNINKLKDSRKIDLRTSTVVVKQNYKILPRIINFLLDLGVDVCHISPAIIDGFAYINKNKIIPKLSDIAPFVHKAIEEVWKRNKQVFIYSIPYCLVQDYERAVAELGIEDTILDAPDFKASIQEHRHDFRMKTESCKQCRYYNICLGVWKRYVKMFGFDEFKPVSGKLIMNSSIFWLNKNRTQKPI